MTQHVPTLLECRDWVMGHCAELLKTTSNDRKDYLVAIDSTRIFVNALDAPLTATLPLLENLDVLTQSFETETNTNVVVQHLKSICEACTPWLDPVSYIRCTPTPGVLTSKYQLECAKVVPRLTPTHYTSMWPNHLNEETTWFRQYFVGNPYLTLIGPLSHDNSVSTNPGLTAGTSENDNDLSDDDPSFVIITIVQEHNNNCDTSQSSIFSDNVTDQSDTDLDEDSDEYSKATTKTTGLVSTAVINGTYYRLIIRNKKKVTRCIVSEESARKTLIHLEALGQGDRLTPSSERRSKQKQKRRPLRSFSSAIIHHTSSLSSSSISSSFSQQRCPQPDGDHINDQGEDHDDEDDDDDVSAAADYDDKDRNGAALHHRHSQHRHHPKQSNHTDSYESYRLLQAAIITIYQHLDLHQFKILTAETNILTGLEKGLLRFDEMEVPKNYKFGLLSVLDNQSSEEQWFSNTGMSDDLEHFLNIIGQRITLQDYKGYAAGLDTKCGESGKYSYVANWKGNEIMFHVGPLMPYNAQDKQQVHRKRYIGNDIVCIVFVESNQPHIFDPGSIRSQFLHVFIVVHPERMNGKKCWRVEVVSNKNVQAFDPPTPSPPLFFAENELREFLILKLVSAENAALQSDKFSIPNGKARQGIFKTLVDTGLAAPIASKQKYSTTLLSSNSFIRSSKNGLDGYLAMMGAESSPAQQQHADHNKSIKSISNFYNFNESSHSHNTPQRPKSAGPTGRNYSRVSMRSLRAAWESPTSKTASTSLVGSLSPSSSSSSSLVTDTRSLTPDPSSSSSSILFPYASRSNMLRDLKNFARRRHSTASSGSRAPTPSSIDGPLRTNSPIYSSCHSSTRRSVESPVSWIDETSTMDGPPTTNTHGPHARPPPPPPPPTSSTSKSYLSSPSHSSTSLNATTSPLLTQSSSTYYSPPSPPPTTLDMMKWTTGKASGGDSNPSIRSRAHHLMSTVMRRKQQQQQPQNTTALLSTSPSSSCSSLANDHSNNNTSSSMISRMSNTKSTYLKD